MSKYLYRGYIYPCTGLNGPLGFQEVEAPRIYRQLAHEVGKVVNLAHRLRLYT